MNKKTVLAVVVLVVMITVTFGMKAEAIDWETDFWKASINASNSGLYMLLNFSGSDWEERCIKLDKEVFGKVEFRNYAKDNLVCVMVDFPHHKKQGKKLKEQNAELAKKYKIEDYPVVIILSPSGSLIGRTGYQEGGVKNYIEQLKKMIDGDKHFIPIHDRNGSPATHRY